MIARHAYLVDGVRTPIGRYAGALSAVRPDDLAAHVVRELLARHGGAIALGHPLGMSGARLALTAALTMADEGHEHALVTMCVGVGQGIATLLARP